jgi:peptidoglycan hydrolase-like protein with peptidoglycan-binding domain
MGTGFLTLQVRAGNGALPVANARVAIKRPDGATLYETATNANGNTDHYALTAPDANHTLDPSHPSPAHSVCDAQVQADGFITQIIRGIAIVDTRVSILPINMHPMAGAPCGQRETITVIAPMGLLQHEPGELTSPPDLRASEDQALPEVEIPEYITVHLGRPDQAAARNIRIRFTDYIKNVASSEMYPTWPQNALVANIHAIVTFALNRMDTKWYRSRGHSFDITNSAAFDQCYREGAPIFENISRITDGIFNIYARRIGFSNPFFTQSCNGATTPCDGLSRWNTVSLANKGMTPIQILHQHYPSDLALTISHNIASVPVPYPGTPLRPGSRGDFVRRMQHYLNRIRVNFPMIAPIPEPDGLFCAQTREAVRAFQQTWNLNADGIAGRETWNKLSSVYADVIRPSELVSEGARIGVGTAPPNTVLRQGARSADVIQLQFILDAISQHYNSVLPITKDSAFNEATQNAVIDFQKAFGLTADGDAVIIGLYSDQRAQCKLYPMITDTPPLSPPQGRLPDHPVPLE